MDDIFFLSTPPRRVSQRAWRARRIGRYVADTLLHPVVHFYAALCTRAVLSTAHAPACRPVGRARPMPCTIRRTAVERQQHRRSSPSPPPPPLFYVCTQSIARRATTSRARIRTTRASVYVCNNTRAG